MIAGYSQHGRYEEALNCFKQMKLEGLSPDEVTFTSILRACGSIGEPAIAKQIHDEIVQQDMLRKDVVLGTALMDMYIKCGVLSKAREVFDGLPVRDVVTWNALMTGYNNQGKSEDTVKSFELMHHEGISPDEISFLCCLKAYSKLGALEQGIQVHDQITSMGLLEKNVVLGTAVVSMYISCGALAKAQQVLQELPVGYLTSWHELIAEYVENLEFEDAWACFKWMQQRGPSPNSVTFAYILKVCGSVGAAEKGQQVHFEIARQGLLASSTVLGNALVDMYAKCGLLEKARAVLQELPVQNVITWNSLLAGYSQHGYGGEALDCFELLKSKGIVPDAVTYTCVLNACACLQDTEQGEQIHQEISSTRLLEKDIVLGNALLDMYAKFAALEKAQIVFDELPLRDVVSWNTLITGYVDHEQAEDALNCLELMQHEGIHPDVVTFVCILKACGSIGAIKRGEEIHDAIARQGLLDKHQILATALVDMYAKCGVLVKALQVLDELHLTNVASLNVLIAGYIEEGQIDSAFEYFEKLQRSGFHPNKATFNLILQACSIIRGLDKGHVIHGELIKRGLLEDDIALGSAVVDMYARCSAFTSAKNVLEKLSVSSVATWNALMAGMIERGHAEEALHCFKKMQSKGLFPDEITFTCMLKACGELHAVEKGKKIHEQISQEGLLQSNNVLGTALIDMYAKCGAIAKAKALLEELLIDSPVPWSTIITAYAHQGKGQEALNWFEQMQSKGIFPDVITFSTVLNACSHCGLVEEGQIYFSSMSSRYGILPDVEHYNCMIDLLGRAGHFDKAIVLIQRMPSTSYPAVWSSLLGACQKWGEVNIGKWAFEHAIQVDNTDAAPYICLINIYEAAGMQEDAKAIKAMKDRNI
ncbi:hypothetical protein KP509_39G035400 [Ceratopteris richardii]|nr:hypothetical protein KP509_39G035400 [Ceratopteris richardii]